MFLGQGNFVPPPVTLPSTCRVADPLAAQWPSLHGFHTTPLSNPYKRNLFFISVFFTRPPRCDRFIGPPPERQLMEKQLARTCVSPFQAVPFFAQQTPLQPPLSTLNSPVAHPPRSVLMLVKTALFLTPITTLIEGKFPFLRGPSPHFNSLGHSWEPRPFVEIYLTLPVSCSPPAVSCVDPNLPHFAPFPIRTPLRWHRSFPLSRLFFFLWTARTLVTFIKVF